MRPTGSGHRRTPAGTGGAAGGETCHCQNREGRDCVGDEMMAARGSIRVVNLAVAAVNTSMASLVALKVIAPH